MSRERIPRTLREINPKDRPWIKAREALSKSRSKFGTDLRKDNYGSHILLPWNPHPLYLIWRPALETWISFSSPDVLCAGKTHFYFKLALQLNISASECWKPIFFLHLQ
ncbi:hypothetical protein CRENBAI_000301 [Crenichthys baileyi]|uniref:Uncharacterized protein n=1 Tax=Crenichthys baileyi TaxID=28760 RepID=A0AAV9RCV0_9TELE